MSQENPAAEAGQEAADISPAEQVLQEAGVAYVLPPPVDAARTLEEFAQRSGIKPSQVLKSLLLDIDGKGHAMLLAPGDRSADFASLRRHFGARSVRLADRAAVEAITGYRIGTVTPLAAKTSDLPILIDEAALAEPFVSLGTGRPGRHVRLAPADLIKALDAQPGPFGHSADIDH